MGVKKQQVFVDAVQAQQLLCVAVGNEAENVAAARINRPDIGDDAHASGAVAAHAVDHEVGQLITEHVGVQQFGVGAMRPLLFAGFFLRQRLAKGESHAGQRADIWRL